MNRKTLFLAAVTLLLARVAIAEDVGWVADVEGTAERQRAGAWAAVAQGETLALGDHVRTPAASRVKLLFRDDSVLTLAENSEITIDEQVVGAKPASSFSVLVGKMRAVVNERYGPSGGRFEVKTPTAIAGVRGTSFITGYDPGRDETQVVCLQHTTAVQSVADPQGKSGVVLGPGESTIVGRGAVPGAPVKLSAAQIQKLTAETTTNGSEGADNSAAADPRLPRRPGERAGSPEGRVVDQPIDLIQKRPVPPPPPPVR